MAPDEAGTSPNLHEPYPMAQLLLIVLLWLPGAGCTGRLGQAFFHSSPQEFILENADAEDVIAQLEVFYPKVRFIQHPTMNGFYVRGPKKDVLAIKTLLPGLDHITAIFSPPDPEAVLQLLQSRVPDAPSTLKNGRITILLTRQQFDQVCALLKEQDLPPPGVLHFRRQTPPTGATSPQVEHRPP